VVGVNRVRCDGGEVVRREQGLVRYDVGGLLDRIGPIHIEREIALPIAGGPLDAAVPAIGVIERGERIGLAELPVVDQILRLLVVDVEAELQARAVLRGLPRLDRHVAGHARALRKDLLHDAGVVDVRPLGQDVADVL
jgi:hypothetical protein